MSIDDTIRIHLQKLVERKSWRANELPQGCTVNVLRVLDDRGLIEFRLWERAEPNPQPFENPDPAKMVVRPNKYCDWFSPFGQPSTAGDLLAVLAHGKVDPELAPEIRASEHGRAKLAELEMAAPIETDLKEWAGKNAATPAVGADVGDANPPGSYIFRFSGNIWHLKFGNEEGTFSDTKGLQRIHGLLKEPDTPISGLILCGGDMRCATLTHSIAETSDQKALDAYRHQIEELDEEIEQAKKDLDYAVQDRCSEDKTKLLAQLSRDTRYDGHTRLLGENDATKRALLAAQASIRDALKALGSADAKMVNMSNHLQCHIKSENHSLAYRQSSPEFSWTL